MFMFTSTLVKEWVKKLDNIRAERDSYKAELVDVKREMEFLKREYGIREDRAIANLKKEVSQSLIESDLKRNEAVAKLAIYEKMDTKADANCIKEMVGNLINAIGKQGVHIIK